MNIMVAGGAGYIGSVLVPMLYDRGYEVAVVDGLWFGNYLPKDVQLIQKDLFELKEADFQKYEQVIFLGGLSNDPMAEFNPTMNFIHNGALPSYLAFTAKKAGVKRFIYASSCSVYGYTVDELYDETSPVTCNYPYGISKLQGERGVMQLVDDDFSGISLRQGTLSGYSPRMRFDLIINTMFKSAMTDKHIQVNNPSIWRPIISVRDTAMAFIRAIQANEKISGIFNVACGNFTVGQIGDLVREEVQKLTGEKIDITIENMEDFRNYKVATKKARLALGFLPQYGIKDILDDLFEHKDQFGDFSSEKFYNIRTFQNMKL